MSHYIVKVYGITCDTKGCSRSEEVVPHNGERHPLRTARRELTTHPDVDQRWVHRDGKDLCPHHAASEADE